LIKLNSSGKEKSMKNFLKDLITSRINKTGEKIEDVLSNISLGILTGIILFISIIFSIFKLNLVNPVSLQNAKILLELIKSNFLIVVIRNISDKYIFQKYLNDSAEAIEELKEAKKKNKKIGIGVLVMLFLVIGFYFINILFTGDSLFWKIYNSFVHVLIGLYLAIGLYYFIMYINYELFFYIISIMKKLKNDNKK
jgi:hypothetical protein